MNAVRGSTTTPGSYPVPAAPVLLAAPSPDEHALAALRRACRTFGWSVVEELDPGRLSWTASVHRPAAVIVPLREAEPSVRVIADLRAVTTGALVVVGDLPSPEVLAVLRAGADVVVPAGLPDEELLARVYAVVRRVSERLAPSTRYLVAGPVHVDLWQRSVRHADTPVHLTATEFDLLAHLMRNSGRTLEPAAIVSRVWGHSGADGLNTLRIFVGRVRAKLGDDARRATLLESVRGHGYRFALPVVELPDEARTGLTAGDQVEHIEGLAEVAEALSRCGTEVDLARAIVDEVVGRGLADGAGVHRVAGDSLLLVAQRGLSEQWVAEVGGGIALDDTYASAHAVRTATPVQLLKLTARQHRSTFRVLRAEDPRSCLFVPILRAGRGEGCLGLLRRTITPHGPAAMAFLRAVCSVYAAELAARRPPTGA